MMRTFPLILVLLVAAIVSFVGAGSAAAQGRPQPAGVQWSLGLGVISSPRPYVGADNQTRLIPVLDVESEQFYFRGIQAGFRWIESGRFSMDIIGRAQFGGYDEGDSSFLAGMGKRSRTIEMGLSAAWELGRFDLEAVVVGDALGRSGGGQASLELTRSKVFGRGRGGLVPGIGLIWQDSRFVDYYAGVRPEEARPGRPAFDGRSALNVAVGLSGFVKLTDRLRFVGLVRAQRLASEYEESPIIDSRWGQFALAALAYRF